jgi:hypothetical protein
MGQQFLKEKLMGLEFRISADAYFQVNTAGAQELYAAVAELAQCDPEKTTMLDICCSAGGIGLSMAKVGLDEIHDNCFLTDKIFCFTAMQTGDRHRVCGSGYRGCQIQCFGKRD